MSLSRQIEIEVPFPDGVVALFTIKVGMSHAIPGGVLQLEPMPMQRMHDFASLVPVIVALGNVAALTTYLCRQLRKHNVTKILIEHEEFEVTTPDGFQRKIKEKLKIERKS